MLARCRDLLRRGWSMGYQTWTRYDLHHGELLAAALAFYGMLSLAPLAVLATTLVGFVFEADRARQTLLQMIRQIATPGMARQTAEILDGMREASSEAATVIALLTLLWAASRLFVQLQTALNAIWGVRVTTETTKETIRRMVIKRLISFAMVVGAGILLMLLVVLNAVLSALADNLVPRLPIAGLTPLTAMIQNYAVSQAVLTIFFAVIYRVLPDARIPWKDVWVGAGLTALMMLGGTAVLGLAIGQMTDGWVHGALGSIAAFVLWIYYQAQVFMLGVAFTREWVERTEGRIRPETHAELR